MTPSHSLALRLAALVLLLVGPSAIASVPSLDHYLPAGSVHASEIPTPAQGLGFEVGSRHARTYEVVRYLRLLEQHSDRVKVVPYARSHGDRELVVAFITSPANLARLDAIQARLEAGEKPIENDPLVVMLAYSIHGNEPSGVNAAPVVAYHLAASRDAEIARLLETTVILLDPALNPDGVDRFAAWTNDNRGRNWVADPQTREHVEGYVTGRSNAYWFDLNRDWLPAAHPESQGRLALLRRWRPHVLGDYHEMGTDTTYFFQPGVATRVHPLTPKANQELTQRLAEFHARAFDAAGELYFTGERFDDFYMGKGSTYMDLFGSVGVLFEQASSRGMVQASTYRGPLTFAETIANQVRASFSLLEGSSALRSELMAWRERFYEDAAREAETLPVQGWRLRAPGDPRKLAAFVELLGRHGIRAHLPGRPAAAGEGAAPGEVAIVPVRQRESRYLRAIFEHRTSFEENAFYDLSTWPLPEAWGLVREDLAAVAAADLGAPFPTEAAPAPQPSTQTSIGWIIDPVGLGVPRAVRRFLDAGVRVHVARDPLSVPVVGGSVVELGRGAAFVPLVGQQEKRELIAGLAATAAKEDGARVHAVASGLTPRGVDLGSGGFTVARRPAVLLVMGEGTRSTEAGALWHALDVVEDMPVTLVELDRLGRVDLSRYTAIVLPPGTYSGVGDRTAEALGRWVESGGTLVAVGTAANWVARSKLAAIETRSEPAASGERRPFDSAESDRAVELVSGALLRVQADLSHPLLFGYTEPTMALFRSERLFLEPVKNAYQTPLLVRDDALLSGYLSERNQRLAAGSAAALVEAKGRGTVVVLADHPTFRGLVIGARRMLMNAILFGPMMRSVGGGDADEEEATD